MSQATTTGKAKSSLTLKRQHFSTSRLLDFLSAKELIAQTGHQLAEWPIVVLKELLDNAIDACEESGIAPDIAVDVDEKGITIRDNGPGIPSEVIDAVMDFSVRVSSREAYVSPTRGAQGNALKTIVAMPYVLNAQANKGVKVESMGVCHSLQIKVDRISQTPIVDHQKTASSLTTGTCIQVDFPELSHDLACSIRRVSNPDFLQNESEPNDLACSILTFSKQRFLQIADAFGWINPHLQLSVRWLGKSVVQCKPSSRDWQKWMASDPTDPHWYGVAELSRLIAANVNNQDRTVREFVCEFKGLSATAKQKQVLDATSLTRQNLSDLIIDGDFDRQKIELLLQAMKAASKPVKPIQLGIIGEEHLAKMASAAGGEKDSFNYKKVLGETKGLPFVLETCFSYRPNSQEGRRIVTGVNWSPGILNPFRQLGALGKSLDSILEQQRVGVDEPVVLVLHVACPKVSYSDRGKSSVIIEE